MAEEHPDDARERFEALAAEVVEPVRRFLARRTDPDTADDVLAETLLVCWRRLDDVPEHALPWVYGVARNCLANAERGERRQVRLAARITVVDPPQEAGASRTRRTRGSRRCSRRCDPRRPSCCGCGRGSSWAPRRSLRSSASLRTPRASGCTARGAISWRSCERSTAMPDMKG